MGSQRRMVIKERRPTQNERMSLEELRSQIDELDQKVVALLNERAELVCHIAEEKALRSISAYVPGREREVLDNLIRSNRGPLSDEALKNIYREIISASRSLERQETVAFYGSPASFTHTAAVRNFGSECEYLPFSDIQAIFTAVEKGTATYGVVPIENSTEGVVPATLDAFIGSPLRISAETYMEIHHNLLSPTSLDHVQRVYSNFQCLAQCHSWLRANLPHAELVECSSSSKGAEAAAQDEHSAAIATRLAAELYGLNILAERIEDYAINRTRFWILGNADNSPTGRDKTSILFSTQHKVGALYEALGVLARHRINLTLIQSRPLKHTPWEYVFYADVEGHSADPAVAESIRELEEHAVFVRVLGSYPVAD